ncbi:MULTISPECIES: transcription elongation factor GreA [Latilactobacillus]|jgi:transcription elongation factor GreA|nr:transcription elongation factor GreA [Latilactobacillus curvatus]MDT3393392.1 transcription elongation factor GreA [Bacillota bacterium]ANY13437.1 transcription elongation factor GreA [Latilactobacillus curvatus]AOO75103.1 transcription elongation factor GreA [Latilactobacillus curvatus]ASN59709.1 transcription elongation factor GreA [Latilactobacillus curvatus]ASN61662.1 transcription elongation factor GreA [Latilactobacillus curvatus]
MVQKTYPMTAEGKEKLAEELETLKMVKRPEVIDRIKIARSFGDLSENSEYESAKDEQSSLETRIAEVENMLRFAEVIDVDSIAADEIAVGKTVSFTDDEDGEEETYQIVGAAESDPFSGKISNDSPIAQALLGKHVGDKVAVQTPGGDMHVTITEVK